MSKLHPNLSHALGDDDGFFDPTDPLVDKSMQGLLKELNHQLSTKYELNLRGVTNQHISYVRVPRTTRDHTFTNSKVEEDSSIDVSDSESVQSLERNSPSSPPPLTAVPAAAITSAGCRITSHRPFITPPSRRLIVPDGCCVDSRRAAVSSTHRATLLAIQRPPHRRHCTPSSPSTTATCVVERFTLVH